MASVALDPKPEANELPALLRPNGEVPASSEEEESSEADLLEHRKASSHHRPLTVFRAVRGSLLLLLMVLSAFWAQAMFGPVWALLRLCNIHAGREFAAQFLDLWLGLWVFLFEQVNGTKFVFSGDNVPPKERVVIIANHLTEVDWMYIWCLAYRKKRLGYVKYALKSSVRNAPIFGWSFHIMEFLLLDRKWELDQHTIHDTLVGFQDPHDPLWFIVFPEGTDFSEEKKLKSQKFARENGLPELHHVLLPRTRGFHACLTPLRKSIDAVYDLTLGYVYRNPTFLENLFGTDPKEVHMHIRRLEVKEVPEVEEKASDWLYKTFHDKDQLMAAFYKTGKFPGRQIADQETSMFRAMLSYPFFLTVSIVVAYFAYTVAWFRLYITVSVVFFTTMVFFKWMPGGGR